MFAVVAAPLVFAIAAGTFGREAHRLVAIVPRWVHELDEAVGFVADRIPEAAGPGSCGRRSRRCASTCGPTGH